ncbi:hypothetical protein [Prosthecobacter sp.]|uniref:hypothetical protein n=1 Tax=Prosthecobacter sp. TaxID=1965333 RepID=UPI0037839C89
MRIRKALLHLEILASLLCALPMAGTAAELSDAGLRAGLTQLATLLAADIPKDARWVLVESQDGRFGIFTERGEDVFRTEGNTFLFNEKPGVEARLVFLSTGTIYPVRAEDASEERAPAQRRSAPEFRATWKNADVSKDVQAAAEWLKKEAGRSGGKTASTPSASIDDLLQLEGNGNPDQLLMHQQTALLWAAILQHTGHEADALTLARAALTGADDTRRKLLLDGCFNRRADQGFSQAMEDFGKQHDWNRLAEALNALLTQFPMGWRQRDAVRVLHHKVAARAKLPPVPPLQTTRPLAEADQKVLLAWLQDLEAGKQLDYSRWTLPSPAKNNGDDDEDEDSGGDSDPFAGNPAHPGRAAGFPRSHGLAAIPLLAALLADDTMTLVNLNQGRHYGGYSHSFGGAEPDAVTKLQQAYKALPKPQTRAQLAWHLLQRVLPSDLVGSDEDNLAEKAPDVLSWYASVKDATPADLALAYFEAGDSRGDIIALAMTASDPKKLARLENRMLDQAQIYDMSPMIPFVEKLGPEKGPAFVAKVRRKLEADLGRYGNDDNGRQRKQMEASLKRLETAAKGEKKTPTIQELLAVMAAYDQNGDDTDQMEVREAFEVFPKLMRKLSPAERLDLILTALPTFKSPAMGLNMLNYALRGEGDDAGKTLKPEERQALLARTRPHWQKLLAAPASDGDEDEPMGLLIQTVSALEHLATGTVEPEVLQETAFLGDRGAEMLRQRAAALLAGQKVEPLPDARAIKSEERQKLLADWGKKTAAEIGRDLETLPADQLLALNQTLLRSGASIPASFQEHARLIQTVKTKGISDAAPWQAWRGKPWSKETLLALATQISTFSGGRLMVQLQRQSPLFGFQLQVSEVPKFTGNWQIKQMAEQLEEVPEELGESFPKLGKRLSAASFQQSRTSTEWLWLDAPNSPKNDATEGVEGMEEMRESEKQAWEALATATGQDRALPTSMTFLSAPTALLVKKERKND